MNHKQFRKEVERTMNEQAKRFRAFSWEDRDAYKSWLSQTFYFVSHSTRLLTLAASRFGKDQNEYHLRFLAHAKEEKNHEILALRDLAHLGVKESELESERAITKAFYERQYFLIEHTAASVFFGYVLALEILAAMEAKGAFARVAAAHGAKAGTFLKVHAEDDLEHIDRAFEMIEKLAEGQLPAILENLQDSCALYCEILGSLGRKQVAGKAA